MPTVTVPSEAFGQFQYPTPPLGVSNEYRNQLLEASMKDRLGDDWSVTV